MQVLAGKTTSYTTAMPKQTATRLLTTELTNHMIAPMMTVINGLLRSAQAILKHCYVNFEEYFAVFLTTFTVQARTHHTNIRLIHARWPLTRILQTTSHRPCL